LIPVFEVAYSSTRGITQIFKGFGEFDLLTLGGKDFSSCSFCERDTHRERERERERERTRDWVLGGFFPTETD
jgi:hypothetical protein